MAILKEDIGPTNAGTLAVAGITNYAGERVFKPVVGSANMVSGATKLGTALAIDSFMSGTVAEGTALGVGVDGVEDLLISVLNQTGTKGMFSMGGDTQRQVM